MVYENLKTFLDKPVLDYSPSSPIDPENYVYRLKVEYGNEDASITDLLESFARDPKAANVSELIIGQFTNDMGDDSAEVVNKLAELSTALPSLKALFIGDIISEECEISWIKQTDITPILQAYPGLEHLQVRGGDSLTFSDFQHDKLKTLIIETGGLPPNVVTQVNAARLPELEILELWLGSDNYGFNSKIEDFAPILSGTAFPKLTGLGLMDSEITDELAAAVVDAPVLSQLKVLDLSMGTLTDKGGAVLQASPGIRKLQHLNLRHHFMSDGMMEQLKKLGISINLDDQEEEDDEYRYAEVTE